MSPYHLLSINVSSNDSILTHEFAIENDCETFEAGAEGKFCIHGSVPYSVAYFYVDAEQDDYLVLSIFCSISFCLYINQVFNGISPETNSVMVGKIHKGRNLIVLDFQKPSTTFSFSCRVSFASYESQPYPDRLLFHNLYIEYVRFSLEVKKSDWKRAGEIQVLLALNNSWNFDDKQQMNIQLLPYWEEKIMAEVKCFPNKVCKLTLPNDLFWNAYILRVSYKLIDGSRHVKNFCVYSPKLHDDRNQTVNTVQSVVEDPGCSNYTKKALKYLLDLYHASPTEDAMAHILKYWDYIRKWGGLDSLIYRRGNMDRFFISALDGKIEKYRISVPKNYNPKMKYALYITVATERYGCDSDILYQCDDENVIWADISCRGQTLGSYIGEASALESIHDICMTYNVDSSRIYLSGSSNGASCVWILAKSYPHLFAGINIVSGYVELNDLENVSNMRVLNVSSQYEAMYAASFESPQKILEKSNKYTGYLAEAMSHSDLMKIRFQQDLIKDLLAHTTNLWPENVNMISTRYMHNRCYWIKIYRTTKANKSVHIRAQILNTKTIEVCVDNASALEVILPNVIDRKRFIININKATYEFEEYDRSSVFFIKDNEKFIVCDEVTENQSRFGVGLLNVFLNPIQIYCDVGNYLAMKVANTFSSPYGNGYDPRIYIKYPVADIAALKSDDDIHRGIVIDNNLNYPLVEIIRRKGIIKTDLQGFFYQNKSYKGDYAVIQLVKGNSPKNDLLYINTNNNNLYQKVLFFRKLTIPSYINGFHPYLNNDALVYYNGKYYGIETYGKPLKLIGGEKTSRSKLSVNASNAKFEPRLIDFQDRLAFENNWSLRYSADQAAADYCINDGVFVPLSGKYACLLDDIVPLDAPYTIVASVYACDRAGIAVNMGYDGKGYAILFLSENGHNHMDFINDDCVWGKHPHVNGQALEYNWVAGEWYKVKLEASISDNELRAKIWKENETEPNYWMFTAEMMRMTAFYRYGTRFVRKGNPGLRFNITSGQCPQFKDIQIIPQEEV